MGFVLLAADEAPMLVAAGTVIKTLPFRSMKCETAPPKPMTTPMPGLMALLFTVPLKEDTWAGWSHGFCYDGNSPLHMLAAKPTAFRSGMFLSFFDIIYHCSTFPINLNDHQFSHHSSNATEGHQGFPSRYGRCQRFIKPIVSKALLVIFSIVDNTITP
ncbi:hypothetical protein CK203_063419 [Vitis vinifera]|uniref:Uncharacterized protein n=1 Tax=Vitis vinifera TaxID=29760 RepID=A0A438G8L6_VITVI|nr:hypothetical protein CK203_063419 [Vitis vinifera]